MSRLRLVVLPVLLTQLDALEEEVAALSAERDVQDEGCPQCFCYTAVRESL